MRDTVALVDFSGVPRTLGDFLPNGVLLAANPGAVRVRMTVGAIREFEVPAVCGRSALRRWSVYLEKCKDTKSTTKASIDALLKLYDPTDEDEAEEDREEDPMPVWAKDRYAQISAEEAYGPLALPRLYHRLSVWVDRREVLVWRSWEEYTRANASYAQKRLYLERDVWPYRHLVFLSEANANEFLLCSHHHESSYSRPLVARVKMCSTEGGATTLDSIKSFLESINSVSEVEVVVDPDNPREKTVVVR